MGFKGKKAPNFKAPKSKGAPVRRDSKTGGPKHPSKRK